MVRKACGPARRADRHAISPGQITLTIALTGSLAPPLVSADEEFAFDLDRHLD
jgi:hypothetical protein